MKLIELFENYNLPTKLLIKKVNNSYDFYVFDYLGNIIPKYTRKNVSLDNLDEYKNSLAKDFPDLQIVENALPGHMGIDFIEDNMVNYTEINAVYANNDKDIDKTLNTLSSQNPSWRKLIDLKGWNYAKNKLIKALKVK